MVSAIVGVVAYGLKFKHVANPINPLVNLVGGHLERKAEEKKAVHERKLRQLNRIVTGKIFMQTTQAVHGRTSGLRFCFLFLASLRSFPAWCLR